MATYLIRIDVYSHNFAVSDVAPSIRYHVDGFARRWVQYGFIKEAGRWIRQAIKGFYSITRDKRIIRFHINQLSAFLQHLENSSVSEDQVEIIRHGMYVPARVELPVFDKWQPRDYQVPAIDYVIDYHPPVSKFVSMQTGLGKSYIALASASAIGTRLLIIVRPMYLDKWQEDVMKTYDIDFQDMVVIRGAASLIALFEQAVEDEITAKVILISNKTLQPYLKLYEQFQTLIKDLGYGVMPYELCEALKVGQVIVDEIHQDFHLNYKLITYFHTPKTISLSATLVSDDDFINNMYEVAFPSTSRYKGEAYRKYVNATALLYKIKNPNKVRCQDYSRKTYSHVMFEQSIMKNKFLMENYLDLIARTIIEYFLGSEHKKGDRCLVYCATIEFCTVVTNYLKRRFPARDVRRYVEDDPYENIMTADISASTIGSAGTGLDIPELTTVIMTVAINSTQSNVQGFGRLRDLKTRRTKFIYFVCEDIAKHREYHDRKRVILQDKALTLNVLHHTKTL